MKKFNRITSLVLILTLLLGTVSVFADTQTYTSTTNQITFDENTFAVEMYESLNDEAKEIFLNYINQRALEGDFSLLEYHINYVDSDYVKQDTNIKGEVDKNTQKMYNVTMSATSTSIAQQLAALNLPTAVYYGLVGFAAALGVPVGNIVDVVIGLGLAAVIALYWNDIKHVWSDIVNIFTNQFGSYVKEAFDYLAAKAQGLPTEKEFSSFEYHYDKHGHEFANMPGGNGKKPDKKKYWEMAKKFLEKTASEIRQGTDINYSNRIIKFNTKTLEYLVYDKTTKQIITYYLPKWSANNATNIPKWSQDALNYFLGKIR